MRCPGKLTMDVQTARRMDYRIVDWWGLGAHPCRSGVSREATLRR